MKSRLPALMKSFSPASATIMNPVQKGVAEPIGGDSAVDSIPGGGAGYADPGVRATVPSFEPPRYRTATRALSKKKRFG